MVVTSEFVGTPLAWTTTDGESWTSHELPFKEVHSTWVVETPWGVEVLASAGNRQFLSSSPDGAAWSKPIVFKNAMFPGRDVTGEAVLLAGATGRYPKTTPALWRSASGGKYERLALGDVRKKAVATAVATLPDGELLIATMDATVGKPRLHRGSWGGAWRNVKLPTTGRKNPGRISLTSVPDGVVLGISSLKTNSLWFSADGRAWEQVAEASPWVRPVRWGDAVYVLGEDIIRTENGREWCSIGRPDFDGSATGIAELADGRLLLPGVEHRMPQKKNANPITSSTGWISGAVYCEPLGETPMQPELGDPPAEPAEG